MSNLSTYDHTQYIPKEQSMTSHAIKQLVNQTKERKQTVQSLREFVLHVAHEALFEHYQGNYSMRCFQSSLVIHELLTRLGINSFVVLGATCLPKIKGTNPYEVSWGGFWGEDHHIWVMTEYLEIVDLTVSHFHLHPMTAGTGINKIPAFWWYPGDSMPTIFKYLPALKPVALVPEEIPDYEVVKGKAIAVLDKYLSDKSTDNIFYTNILHGPETLNHLLDSGDHWAKGGLVINDMNLPHPDWILKREAELLNNYR